NIGFSVEHSAFEINLNARYNGEFRTLAGSGNIPDNERVDANFVIDASGKYFVNNQLSLTANIINLLDETYAASRVPAGLRPGHPFGAYVGLEFRF
ncbi:MAG: TonB-dependent receptor, partial [Flavobacteriales bacterium]